MKKRYFLFSCVLLSLLIAAGSALAQDGGKSLAVGQALNNFTLPDADGKQHSLDSLRGKNGTVMVFLSTQCPFVRDYMERIEKLAQDYRAKGVNVVGINSNYTESLDDMKAHASSHHLSFTVLKDKDNKVADMLGATRTPEAFFLDGSGKLIYRGRIDNNRNVSLVNSNDLRDAINSTLEGKPVAKTETSAFGCTIKRAS